MARQLVQSPTTPGLSPTTGMANAGTAGSVNETDPMAPLKTMLLMQALKSPKNASKYSTIMGMIPQKSQAVQQKEEDKKMLNEQVNNFVTQIEDQYFTNKLYKGNNPITKAEEIATKAGLIQNSPYAIYYSNLNSQTARLAKLAGDVGNISVVEQMKQLQAFPGIRNDRKAAEKKFKFIRSNLGLPERNYNVGSGGSQRTDISAAAAAFEE